MGKYYMAVDAGGSKVHLLLFDEMFHRLDFDVAASSNPNLNPIPTILHNMEKTYKRMFARNPQVHTIACVYVCALCSAELLLSPLEGLGITYQDISPLGEGVMGMYANCVSDSAVVALSGTGSDIHCVMHGAGAPGTVGGWGALVADEGSGYWIGREAMLAAIHHYELRGPETMLTRMLMDRLYPDDFGSSIFSVYESSSPARSVAAMSRMVDEAARAGDAVSLDILHRAARLLAEQIRTVYLKHPEYYDFPLLVTGGSYKNYRLFDWLCEEVEKLYPGKQVRTPLFEPVVGGVFAHAKRIGLTDEVAKELLVQNFREDLYLLPEN